MLRSFVFLISPVFGPLGLLVMSAFGAAGSTPGSEADGVECDVPIQLSAQPAEQVSILGEPVWVLLRFENRGRNAVSIDLGTSDVDRLAVTWRQLEGGEDLVERQGDVQPGLTFPLVVAIPPGGGDAHLPS